MSEALQKIALLGNPNAGKSSLFNQLTGLRQKVGNFPGVTVERKSGFIKLDDKCDYLHPRCYTPRTTFAAADTNRGCWISRAGSVEYE